MTIISHKGDENNKSRWMSSLRIYAMDTVRINYIYASYIVICSVEHLDYFALYNPKVVLHR